MSFLDDLFGSNDTKTSSTSTVVLPDWVNKAAETNYNTAAKIASRPYVAYPYQRIAGFTGDQNNAMSMLRNYAPTARANGQPFSAPRLIDNIGPGGSIEAYMNPYIDQVLDRTQSRIREATNMAQQWGTNMASHQEGAFGDARQGIAQALTEEKGIAQMRDAAAEAYAAAYDNAQGLRQHDIARMFDAQNVNNQNQRSLLEYIDSLYRSGSNQQALDQQSMELMYQDFLRQQNYPIDQFNLLVAGLNNSPYGKTVTETQTTPAPSTASQILGTVGSIASLFL